MDRRALLAALACCPAGAVLAQGEAARPRHKITAAELYDALAARFPLRFGAKGLLEVQVDAPRLLLLPARQQLGATLQLQAAGAQLPRSDGGEVDLVFALRYEAADRTLRAVKPQVFALRWPGLPAATGDAISRMLNELAAQRVGEIVLHAFTAGELGLADTMGFEPAAFTVVNDGLVIEFARKLSAN